LYLIVSDIEAARNDLLDHGINVSKVFPRLPAVCMPAWMSPTCLVGNASAARIPTMAVTARSPHSKDPDGNGWLFQEVSGAPAGRIDPANDDLRIGEELACALRRAAAAHGHYESASAQRTRTGPTGTPNIWPRASWPRVAPIIRT